MNLVQIRISIRKVPTNFEIIHFMPGTNNLIYFAVHCLSKYSINKLRKPNSYYIFLSQITVVRKPQIHNNIGLWQEPKVLTTIIETYRVRNNKNVTLRYTTLVTANIKAATCFGYAKRLSSGCMSENIKGKYIEYIYIQLQNLRSGPALTEIMYECYVRNTLHKMKRIGLLDRRIGLVGLFTCPNVYCDVVLSGIMYR